MAYTDYYTYSYTPSVGGTAISGTLTFTADGVDARQVALAGTANQRITIAVDVTEVETYCIKSTVDCTIYTNDTSGGTPDNTIAITANKPLIWYTGCYFANLLTVDVTDFYITPTGTGTFEVAIIQDATP